MLNLFEGMERETVGQSWFFLHYRICLTSAVIVEQSLPRPKKPFACPIHQDIYSRMLSHVSTPISFISTYSLNLLEPKGLAHGHKTWRRKKNKKKSIRLPPSAQSPPSFDSSASTLQFLFHPFIIICVQLPVQLSPTFSEFCKRFFYQNLQQAAAARMLTFGIQFECVVQLDLQEPTLGRNALEVITSLIRDLGLQANIFLPRSTRDQPNYTVWIVCLDPTVFEETSSIGSLEEGSEDLQL